MKKMKTGNLMAIVITVAAICLSGCTGEENPVEQNQTEVSSTQENIPGMEKVDSTVPESTEGEADATQKAENATQDTLIDNTSDESAEKSDITAAFDVQKILEEAETEASAKQKKLQEDSTLTQGDMNVLSGEIYQIWDGVLNELWKNLKGTLAEEALNDLLEEQRVWIAEKEAEVKLVGEENGGGSLAPLLANDRAAKLTRARVYELASYLGFEGTLIPFTVEGMVEIVPATVFEGLHYTIAIPKEGWEMIATECWASDANEKVQFGVTDYAGEDVDAVLDKLIANGYENIEWDTYRISRIDEEGLVHQVQLFTENEETIGVFYCYPEDAAEGFGTRLRTIVDTFEWKFE